MVSRDTSTTADAATVSPSDAGSSAGHTPGQWGVEDPMDHCLAIIANPEAPTYDWVWVACCDWPDEDDHDITSAEVKANARLISAAPQLLEVVLMFLAQYPGGINPGLDSARKLGIIARAKATGK